MPRRNPPFRRGHSADQHATVESEGQQAGNLRLHHPDICARY